MIKEDNSRNAKQVDIHLPVKKGKFIAGHVLQRLLDQRIDGEVETTLYVDASTDLPVSKKLKNLFEDKGRIEVNFQAAYKRNKMLKLGESDYVYFADPDVLLPEVPPDESIFANMIRGLERHPRLGAVGVRYQKRNHLATGSMMLRREDLERIGEIKWGGESCICNYIAQKLWELDKFVMPFRTIRAKHLYREHQAEYPEYVEETAVINRTDHILDQDYVKTIIKQHGTHFKLRITCEDK